ncbi:MAG: choice-of-anchor D domain-containing protein [Paramuribaculum sp.]|nr:choice-of-anchor D domain-containing protein [Paramuribaculum sp.]
MNKFCNLAVGALMGVALASPAQANATVFLDENFSYDAGELYNQGNWLRHSKNTNEPIQLVNPALTYEGYQNEATGFSAKLIGTDATTAHERLQKQFSDEGIITGSVYAAALFNVTEAPSDDVYFFTLCQRGAKADAGIIDTKSGSEYARVFASPGSTDGKFKLGLSKNGSAPQATSDELELNTTYLVVIKYTFIDGSNNDELVMWINPADHDSEPQADLTADSSKADVSTSFGLQGVTLRQGSTGMKIGPNVLVDAVRVTDSWADLWQNSVATDEPTIDIRKELLIDPTEWVAVNTSVQFAKFKVTAKNLAKPAMVYHAGKNRDQFSINVDEIPAGNSETEIIVTYSPTTTGLHSGSLTIDAMPTELSQSFAFNARAYDPDHMPVITVNSEGLTQFNTTVGNPVSQTVTYSTEALLDYGTIKVIGGDGQFRISSGSMLKDSKDMNLTITFSPLTAGIFNATIEFSADKAETRTIAITGIASGSAPVEDKQGDEFTMASFDTSNARALVIEDFQNCGQSNQPLHIDGWTNAAITGTRAWWAYTDINDPEQRMAKITAYDSKAEESSFCQMLLLSPCLDYVNAKQQLLTFRIMGKNMYDTQVDNLQVLYIDPTTNEQTTLDLKAANSPLDQVYAEAINGLDIPASADYNGEWRDYVLDLNGLELADKFFIGFGFASMRGHDSSTMYFIDDFSWGRNDIPFIRINQPYLNMEATIYESATSLPITVEGLNLTGPVTLKVTGDNASKFTVEPTTLPAEGGTFTVSFTSDLEGVHSCYIQLSADGAPDSFVSVEANNLNLGAITSITTDTDNSHVEVYNLQGILIKSGITKAEALKQLPAGLYIVGGQKVYVK